MTTMTHGPALDLGEAAGLVDAVLASGGIRTLFQPVVRVADGVVIGYEALSQAVMAPDVSPRAWLAAAGQLGRRAEVELACLLAAADVGPPPGDGLLFLNVSPDVALHPDLPMICRRLRRHVLEVTEHAAVKDYAPLLTRLSLLRSQGSLVAVDDVGSGYASMTHVLQLSPSFIKIDLSLVQGLHRDPRRRALVEALQAFASAVGALTVAEGVETEAELRALQEIGVDLVQGYLLSRPGPAWPGVADKARAVLAPPAPPTEGADLSRLATALAGAPDVTEASEVVSRYLARQGGLLPSIYLERGGVLRCQSRRGQLLVMDGLQPRVGITGAAFADETEILCTDVSADPRYRQAVPGVCSEMAVPLTVLGRTVGVLNVDSLAPLLRDQSTLIRLCARLLEDRLTGLAEAGAGDSTLHELSRLAPTLARAGSPADLCDATVAAVAQLTGFDSGCVWSFAGDEPVVEASLGPAGDVLAGLDHVDVLGLRDAVATLSSCYSGGTDLSLAVAPTQVLRGHGARGVVLLPIRDGWQLTDLLVLTSTTTSFVPADIVDAVESLCLQAGSRLATLRRVAELEGLVHRDALTGLGNRGLWDVVLADASLATPGTEPLWLAIADVDRFKLVNDTFGHVCGDEVLQAVAGTLSSLPGWSVFRLGGDEFTLIGPGGSGSSPTALAEVVERAWALLEPYGASLSVGAVRTDRAGLASARDLADQALYRRKRQGGAGVTISTPPGAAVSPRPV